MMWDWFAERLTQLPQLRRALPGNGTFVSGEKQHDRAPAHAAQLMHPPSVIEQSKLRTSLGAEGLFSSPQTSCGELKPSPPSSAGARIVNRKYLSMLRNIPPRDNLTGPVASVTLVVKVGLNR
jgi:hypothetical protein